jgi:hypothetical protein
MLKYGTPLLYSMMPVLALYGYGRSLRGHFFKSSVGDQKHSRIPVVHPLYDDLLHLDRFMMLQVLVA